MYWALRAQQPQCCSSAAKKIRKKNKRVQQDDLPSLAQQLILLVSHPIIRVRANSNVLCTYLGTALHTVCFTHAFMNTRSSSKGEGALSSERDWEKVNSSRAFQLCILPMGNTRDYFYVRMYRLLSSSDFSNLRASCFSATYGSSFQWDFSPNRLEKWLRHTLEKSPRSLRKSQKNDLLRCKNPMLVTLMVPGLTRQEVCLTYKDRGWIHFW